MTVDPLSTATNPYHIARAYGVPVGRAPVEPPAQGEGARPAAAVQPVRRVQNAQAPDGPLSLGSVREGERAQPTQAAANDLSRVRRLVAGVVPGGIDFREGGPVATGSSLTIYRHPADRNAAATGVTLGKGLDICG